MNELFVFGNPDGAGLDEDELMHGYITNGGSPQASTGNKIGKKHIIVGAKGAGKTFYLRKIREELSLQKKGYLLDIDREFPMSSQIKAFSREMPSGNRSEFWKEIWRMALMRALTSHLLENSDWNHEDFDEELTKSLINCRDHLFPEDKVPMLIGTAIKRIITEHPEKESIVNYVSKSDWNDLRFNIKKCVKKTENIYFFIDSIDEEYENNPKFWRFVQEGLFFEMLRLEQDKPFGDKVQLYVAIRDDIVASLVERSQHGIYLGNIQKLSWNWKEMKRFFSFKIQNLDDSLFILDEGEKDIGRWLSITDIEDIWMGGRVDVMDYILDHTRLLPRDLVEMGNALAEIKFDQFDDSETSIEDAVQQCVQDKARSFGNELASICANRLHRELKPFLSRGQGSYSSDQEYNASPRLVLLNLINDHLSKRMKWGDLEKFEARLHNNMTDKTHSVLNVLWQSGMIGYLAKSSHGKMTEKFFDGDISGWELPQRKIGYVLRTCVAVAADIGIYSADETYK